MNSLVILKIDKFQEALLIPIIDYEIYHPITKEKLDLNLCKNNSINLNIPVFIDENNLFKYDPKSDYYTDECFPYTTINGTDILLNDRQFEYNYYNMAVCENNCSFTNYDTNTKQVECECEVKNKEVNIFELNDTDILYYNFTNKNLSSNMKSMKCVYTLFTKDGLEKNIASYIIIFFIAVWLISGSLFYKWGFNTLEQDIYKIIEYKYDNNEKNKDKKIINIKETININVKKNKIIKNNKKNTNIKETIDINVKKNKIIKKNKNNKKINNIKLEFNTRKQKKVRNKKIIKNKLIDMSNSLSKCELNKNKNIIFPKKNKKSEKTKNVKNNQKLIYNDFELNTMPYRNAIKYDKRPFLSYYISLIRTKHPIIFSFCPIRDYNSIIIRIDIFILSFTIFYFFNALFFNESIIHKIYEDEGIYNFIYLIPFISYSFIISHFIIILLKYFSLSERNISEIQFEKTAQKANHKADKIKKILIIKYICFFIVGLLFLLFLWYYLSSFGAVFQNSQVYLIKNTLISYGLALIYPFIINVIIGIFRIYSLGNSNRESIYNIVKIIQLV